MLKNSIVFVLGAGASCSYGYPSGRKLKAECVAAIQHWLKTRDEFNFASLDRSLVLDREIGELLATSLQMSAQPSIDSFLNANRHQQGFDVLGKGAIAKVLLAYEQASEGKSSDDDWLGYLVEVMIDDTDSVDRFCDKNKVGFVTFNYDRSLERSLFSKIKYSFGLNDTDALEAFRKIPIVHTYGTLGEFPDGERNALGTWRNAARSIRTIFDAQHDDDVIVAAKTLLSTAKHICMLGFGFHRENIELLDLVSVGNRCPGIFCRHSV